MTRSIPKSLQNSVRRRSGFTLVEVLLVLAILGVIAAMVVPNLLGRQKAAMIKTTQMSIKSLEDAAKQYAVDHDGDFPANVELLTQPGKDSGGKSTAPYLEKIPLDAWGNPLHYHFAAEGGKHNGLKPDIYSNGPNREDNQGSPDDVTNWN